MKSSTKNILIMVGIVAALLLVFFGMYASANNKVVFLEEQIRGAEANVEVAEKRRSDLIPNLVDCVREYDLHEYEVLTRVVAARGSETDHQVEHITTLVQAVAEDYPELKANENYKQLMNELALTENQIAQYRNNYNEQVRTYNRTIRSIPTRWFLNMMGYERIDYEYTDYNASEDAPTNLFD